MQKKKKKYIHFTVRGITCQAVKIYSCNLKIGARFSLSVLFIFLFLLLCPSHLCIKSLPAPVTPPSTLFCLPHAVSHQNIAQRCSEGRNVQLGPCHHLVTAATPTSLICKGRKDRVYSNTTEVLSNSCLLSKKCSERILIFQDGEIQILVGKKNISVVLSEIFPLNASSV